MLTVPVVVAAEPPADELIQRLARPAPDMTTFVEVRFSALLTSPLVVSGELEHRADGALVRRVLDPYRETTTLTGENVTVERDKGRTRRFSLDRAPELRGILFSFGAMLKGDTASLRDQFDVSAEQAGDEWRIDLVPRSEKLQARLSEIRIDGHADRPVCMTMSEPDGDATIMALGVSSRTALPSTLEREPLESWCTRANAD